MTLRPVIVDGFDHYNTNGNLTLTPGAVLNSWNQSGGPNLSFVTGLSTQGKALKMSSTTLGQTITRQFPDYDPKVSGAWAMRWEQISVSEQIPFMYLLDSFGNIQFSLRMNPSQRITLHRADNTQVGTPSTRIFDVGITYRFNIALDISGGDSGSISLWCSGEEIEELTLTGVDIRSTSDSQFGGLRFQVDNNFPGSPTANEIVIDDVWFGVGDNINLGELEVFTRFIAADVIKQWTPLTGTSNAAMVNESSPDGDTSYNYSTTIGQHDVFSYPAPSRTPESIICVTTLSLVRKEESATRTIKQLLHNGTTFAYGPDQNLEQTYDYKYSHWLQNPFTVDDWAPTDLTTLNSGYETVL